MIVFWRVILPQFEAADGVDLVCWRTLAWRLVSSISIPSMSDSLICLLIWRQNGQMVTTKKSWRSMPIQLFWSWMRGFYWNQRIQNKGTSSNCFIGDVRNLQRFSVPSMHSRNGMSSSAVVTVLWQMQSLTVLPTTAIE